MHTLQTIEAIRRLKARYFRCLDSKEWAQLRACFTDDFTALVEGPHPDIVFNNPEEYITTNTQLLNDVVTVHQGHTSEIDVLSETEAKGIWSMYDRVEMPDNAFEGWGHYHETYRLVDGQWKISRMHITRLAISPLSLPTSS